MFAIKLMYLPYYFVQLKLSESQTITAVTTSK